MFKYIAAAVVAASPLAADNCAATGEVLDTLADKYGEHITAQGVQNNGDILSVLTDPNDGSYTVIVSRGGQSCMVAAGADMVVNPLLAGEDT